MSEANGRRLPELTQLELDRLLDLVESSDITLLHVRSGDAELTLSRGGEPPTVADVRSPQPVDLTTPSPQERPTPTSRESPPPDAVAVRAPFAGIFYRASTPGAPPYVDVGTEVDIDTSVGLIEAMKVYTAVRAGMRGTIERFDVANEIPVESGEVILWIRPLEP